MYHSLSCDFDCISAITLQSIADIATPFLYIYFLKIFKFYLVIINLYDLYNIHQ